ILASFALAGLYLYLWKKRLKKKAREKDDKDPTETKVEKQGKRLWLQVMIGTSGLQLLSGTWLLMSFERNILLLYIGDDVLLTSLLIASILVTLLMIFFLVLLMKHDKRKYFIMSLASFVLVLGIMGWMRHELREVYLDP